MQNPEERTTVGWIEKAVIGHVAVLSLFSAWAFGGQAPFARIALLAGGSIGILLFVAICTRRKRAGGRNWTFGVWMLPLFAYDLIACLGAFNPSLHPVAADSGVILVLQDPPFPWLPSSARPELAMRELWLLNGIVASAFNLRVVTSRRRLRALLMLLAANAALLAIFGTFQKLSHAPGLWFGSVDSPNEFFFATFVYHNHWGAFALLHTAICAGFLLHYYGRQDHRDVWHSPLPVAAVCMLVLTATVPLSGSRSGTILISGLWIVAAIEFCIGLLRRRREQRRSAVLPVTSLLLLGVIAAAGMFQLARPVIQKRAQHTIAQLSSIKSDASLDSRLQLYQDTWRMAEDKIWFGWGLESYAHIFQIYNRQRPAERWFRARFFAEAHSDWLQSLAENGLIGTALLALLAIGPVGTVRRTAFGFDLSRYLLAGCGLTALYACVEFPFANPSVLLIFWTALFAASRLAALEVLKRRTAAHP